MKFSMMPAVLLALVMTGCMAHNSNTYLLETSPSPSDADIRILSREAGVVNVEAVYISDNRAPTKIFETDRIEISPGWVAHGSVRKDIKTYLTWEGWTDQGEQVVISYVPKMGISGIIFGKNLTYEIKQGKSGALYLLTKEAADYNLP